MPYNTMYERLCDQGDDQVSGFVAYGLYKHAKREWAASSKRRTAAVRRLVTNRRLTSHLHTADHGETLHTQANTVLAQFASGAVEDARPEILKDALKGSVWKTIRAVAVLRTPSTRFS
jgi:hypothetical protein